MKTVLKLVLGVAGAGCLVGVGVAIGTSGGESAPTAAAAEQSGAVTANESTKATSTPEPTPDPDTDGDGVNDPADAAPRDPHVQDEADKKSCDYLGINHKERKEGSCVESGMKVKIVNRGTPLSLKQMTVTTNSIAYTDTIPVEHDNPLVGSFVVADVTITNNLDAPVNIDATDMFALVLGKKRFTPDSDAMIEAQASEDKFIYDDVQPGEDAHGKVVFRVPASAAHKLDTIGNLLVAQFSDSDLGAYGGGPKQRVGVIRTYQ